MVDAPPALTVTGMRHNSTGTETIVDGSSANRPWLSTFLNFGNARLLRFDFEQRQSGLPGEWLLCCRRFQEENIVYRYFKLTVLSAALAVPVLISAQDRDDRDKRPKPTSRVGATTTKLTRIPTNGMQMRMRSTAGTSRNIIKSITTLQKQRKANRMTTGIGVTPIRK